MLQFCCLGPQRTATSWLHEVVSHHPQACLPRGVKETMFFDRRSQKGLDWYRWHFDHAQAGQVLGEVAPTYFDSRDACNRLKCVAPDVKLIVLVRNPVERLFSLYRHHLSKGRIRVTFEEALDSDPWLISSGRYSVHAAYWESVFSSGQFLYILQDDIQCSPQAVVDRFCDFVGIGRFELPDVGYERINSATAPVSPTVARLFSATSTLLRSARMYTVVHCAKRLGLKAAFSGGREVPPMCERTRSQLMAEFAPDVRWLEHRLGIDLAGWRSEGRSTIIGPDVSEY